MSIRWDEITVDYIINLDKVLTLYDQTFPIEVREPHETFLRSLQYARNNKPNNFRFLIGFEGENLVSFATGHYLADVNLGFIVYIATNPRVRSHKGLGSKTLLKMEELLNQDARLAGNSSLTALILETEIQEMVHTETERKDCIKRNHFFEKNQYKKYQDINYLQPPLFEGGSPIPLNLFVKGSPKEQFFKKEISEFIRCMYREKYYLVNGIDKKVLINCFGNMGMETEDLFKGEL